MKPNKNDKLDLSVSPITGLPNDHKLYYYPKPGDKQPEADNDEQEDKETSADMDDKRMAMLLERLRWKGARRIRGYRFKGTIPPPKHATDYMPWLREE